MKVTSPLLDNFIFRVADFGCCAESAGGTAEGRIEGVRAQ